MQDAPAYEVLVVVPAAGAPLQPALDFAAQPRQAGLAASGDDLVAWERPAGGVSVLLPAVRLNATRDLAPCGAPSARLVCLPSESELDRAYHAANRSVLIGACAVYGKPPPQVLRGCGSCAVCCGLLRNELCTWLSVLRLMSAASGALGVVRPSRFTTALIWSERTCSCSYVLIQACRCSQVSQACLCGRAARCER